MTITDADTSRSLSLRLPAREAAVMDLEGPVDEVTPLPRPAAVELEDRGRAALAVLRHRPWCPRCAPHAAVVAAVLDGVPVDQIRPAGER